MKNKKKNTLFVLFSIILSFFSTTYWCIKNIIELDTNKLTNSLSNMDQYATLNIKKIIQKLILNIIQKGMLY